MMASNADLTRGFDVMKGAKVVAHFDTYEEAWEYARPRRLTVRYWGLAEEGE